MNVTACISFSMSSAMKSLLVCNLLSSSIFKVVSTF